MLVILFLKTADTVGNCQRPVFSLGVSQHMQTLNYILMSAHLKIKLMDLGIK